LPIAIRKRALHWINTGRDAVRSQETSNWNVAMELRLTILRPHRQPPQTLHRRPHRPQRRNNHLPLIPIK
jgi:hypothetical protein